MNFEELYKHKDEFQELIDWDSQKQAVEEAFMRGYELAKKEVQNSKEYELAKEMISKIKNGYN